MNNIVDWACQIGNVVNTNLNAYNDRQWHNSLLEWVEVSA